MAVQSDTSRISYAGNNSTSTSYAVPFYFLENSHLAATAKVIATGVETAVTLNSHTGAGDPNGGTVRTTVAVPATSTLTIFRVVPATQTTTYQEGGDFPAASHERALDKLTMLAQQNDRATDRAIRVTEADGARADMVAVPNTLVGLDANKNPKALTPSEVKTFLALTGVALDVDAGTKTFLDAGERALAVPDFVGQLGSQRDTNDVYISTGVSAGDWSLVNENVSLADFSAGFFTADATGRGKFGGGFVDTTLLEDDAVTPAKLAQPLTLATSVATTSGTSIDFTGIPSWVKRITVMLGGVSVSGVSNIAIRLGTSGGFVTSGYLGVGSNLALSPTFANNDTGFRFSAVNADTSVWHGSAVLTNLTNNVWTISGALGRSDAEAIGLFAGSVNIGGQVDRLRVTTLIGTDTFDAGSVNIMYEG
jgi:hypothetical protein